MVIIETQEEYERMLEVCKHRHSLVIPILSDAHLHPILNTVSVVYIEVDDAKFLVPYNHNEGIAIPGTSLNDLRNAFWVMAPSKKTLMHVAPEIKTISDVNGLEYLRMNKVTEAEKFYPPAMQHMLNRFHHRENVLRSVPLMILMEFCTNYAAHLQNYAKFRVSDGSDFLNGVTIPVARFMEASGIQVVSHNIIERYGERQKRHIKDNLIYTEYNPYTAAGRLSCAHGGLNFVAMDKSDGSREAFVSRHEKGALVLIDFESFHPRLIGEMINFPLPTTSLHTYFGQQYFGVDELTPEQYNESKQITFKLLYSDEVVEGIPDYFYKVQEFRKSLWDKFTKDGYVQSLSGRKFHREFIENPSPAKLFNYWIQLRETEFAVERIQKLMPIYGEKKSKIILYTYDSLLIDFNLNDGKELLSQTTSVLSKQGKFPVRTYYGKNYHKMTACK